MMMMMITVYNRVSYVCICAEMSITELVGKKIRSSVFFGDRTEQTTVHRTYIAILGALCLTDLGFEQTRFFSIHYKRVGFCHR